MSLTSVCATFCTLQRQTVAKDASGGLVTSFANVTGYVDLTCDIQPASGNVRLQYQHMQTTATHTIYFADNVSNARAGDRFQAVDDSGTTHTYLFRGVRTPSPGRIDWPTVIDVEEQLE